MSKDFSFTPVKQEVVDGAFEKALFAAREQMLTDCNYFCRQDQGTLIDSSQAKPNGLTLEISWNTPYAKRVYYTGNPSKNVNPNASLQWAEKAKNTYGKEWQMILAKGMGNNL